MAGNHNNTAIKAMTYNGTAVKKWYHNGVLVFSSSTPYYAIQNGKRVNCPNASCWVGGSLLIQTGDSISDGLGLGISFYGGSSHTGGDGPNSGDWGADTGTLDTKGCKYLYVGAYVDMTQYTLDTATLTIYGNGGVIKTEKLANTSFKTTRTIDVSAYSNVRVHINGRGWNEELMIRIGLTDVRLHN